MKFTSGYNLLPSKKGVMGGKVIYGKDVLDRNIFKRHNISPITTGGVRIGWRISDVIKHQPLEKPIDLLKNQ